MLFCLVALYCFVLLVKPCFRSDEIDELCDDKQEGRMCRLKSGMDHRTHIEAFLPLVFTMKSFRATARENRVRTESLPNASRHEC